MQPEVTKISLVLPLHYVNFIENNIKYSLYPLLCWDKTALFYKVIYSNRSGSAESNALQVRLWKLFPLLLSCLEKRFRVLLHCNTFCREVLFSEDRNWFFCCKNYSLVESDWAICLHHSLICAATLTFIDTIQSMLIYSDRIVEFSKTI